MLFLAGGIGHGWCEASAEEVQTEAEDGRLQVGYSRATLEYGGTVLQWRLASSLPLTHLHELSLLEHQVSKAKVTSLRALHPGPSRFKPIFPSILLPLLLR